MNETSFGLESAIRKIVEEEINKQLGPTVTQAIGEGIAAEEKEIKYLSVKELSSLTGLKKATIYGKRSRRELPAYKFGRELRFRRDEIDAWMQSKKTTCIVNRERRGR